MATTDTAVWRERGNPLVAGSGSGPLHGVRLAVKDVHAVMRPPARQPAIRPGSPRPNPRERTRGPWAPCWRLEPT